MQEMQETWVQILGWRRNWQTTPGFLPEKFHEQRSLAGCSPWGPKGLDATKHTWMHDVMHEKLAMCYSEKFSVILVKLFVECNILFLNFNYETFIEN